MINVVKSQPAPPCLAIEASKPNGNYACNGVITQLEIDFKGKCYICDSANPRPIAVEHFKPKSRYPMLKFDWNNLFYVCGHCNGIKLDKPEYDEILNCTDSHEIITDLIEFIFDPIKEESPEFILTIPSTPKSQATAELLDEIFEGNTENQQIAAANLKKDLILEMSNFYREALCYLNPSSRPSEKIDAKEILISLLGLDKPFLGFKIWVIKNNQKLKATFEEYIPDFKSLYPKS